MSTNVPTYVCPSRRASGLVGVAATAGAPTGDGVVIAVSSWMHSDYAGNRGAWASTPSAPTSSDTVNRSTTFGPVGNPVSPGTYPSTASAAGFLLVSVTLSSPQVVPVSGVTVATGGVIFAGSAVSPAAVRDGLSSTYLIAEKYVPAQDYMSGLNPRDDQCAFTGDSSDTLRGGQRVPERDATPWQANVLEGVFGGPHSAVFNAAFCDGSVQAIGFDIDAATHFLLAARGDRQPVQLPQ